jgi:Tol biopolymer transport system component
MAIVTCRLGETNFQALTPWKGFNYPLAGSPDGKRLLFTTEDTPGGGNLELWTMNLDGTDRRKLVERKFACDRCPAARWVKRPH